MVDNNFYDPELDAEFGFRNPATFSEDRFWQGDAEPIWVTVEKQGGISAAMFWGGTNVEIGGVRPTYWHRYDGSIPTRIATVVAQVVKRLRPAN